MAKALSSNAVKVAALLKAQFAIRRFKVDTEG